MNLGSVTVNLEWGGSGQGEHEGWDRGGFCVPVCPSPWTCALVSGRNFTSAPSSLAIKVWILKQQLKQFRR